MVTYGLSNVMKLTKFWLAFLKKCTETYKFRRNLEKPKCSYYRCTKPICLNRKNPYSCFWKRHPLSHIQLFLFFRQEKIRSNIFNTGNNFYKISFLFQNILFVPIVVLVNFKLSCSLLFFIQEKSCLWRPFPPQKINWWKFPAKSGDFCLVAKQPFATLQSAFSDSVSGLIRIYL